MEHISTVLKRVKEQTIRNAKTMRLTEITLHCPICKTWTKHVISASGKYLVCACGDQIEYVQRSEAK